MFYHSLMAGQSRGFTLMTRWTAESGANAGGAGRPDAAAEATRADLVAALRFPLAPSWILQRSRPPLPSVLPAAAAPQPRGCG